MSGTPQLLSDHRAMGEDVCVFILANLPAVYYFCKARLNEEFPIEDGVDDQGLRLRLEHSVHALRTLVYGNEAWHQADADVRKIAARYATHPEYPALGLDA
ncbi:hypothetical protein [Amycolatopsis taiwanensis]|uniref:hypothetical protein n=1 Tax=Amycolatopsis taiwanensis TaxID=342230 RepID=UPI00047F7F4B|nr:hypothetical protein [Amycolatopsis taiwanensis]